MFPDGPSFGIRVLHHQARTVMHIVGEIDLATAPRLRSHLDDVMADADGAILLDLAEVTFLDSTGVHAIATAFAELDGQDRELRVVNVSAPVRRVFELCGINYLVVENPASGDAAMSA